LAWLQKPKGGCDCRWQEIALMPLKKLSWPQHSQAKGFILLDFFPPANKGKRIGQYTKKTGEKPQTHTRKSETFKRM